MRLKYKLFFSYLILIAFLSLALILQITQIGHLDRTIKIRVEKNVREIIDLSLQQQQLEKVFDLYLVFSSSGSQKRKQTELINNVREYSKKWEDFKLHSEKTPDSGFLLPMNQILNKYLESTDNDLIQQKRQDVQEKCEVAWAELHTLIINHVRHGDVRMRSVKQKIDILREHLLILSGMIGDEARISGVAFASVTKMLRMIILAIIGGTVALSIVIALFVTRKISKPVEELRQGVEQVAIQDYDVQIKHKTNDEIGDLADAFQQMARRLQKNEMYKTDILSQFTHEMKSPLGAIKQAVNLLASQPDKVSEKDHKRLISIIKGNNDNLFRLISNILNSSTAQDKEIKLAITWENIVTLISNELVLLSPSIKKKNMQVKLNFDSRKIECDVDLERMKEVVKNLVSNSIKFSPDNSEMTVSVNEKYPAVIIKLKDQGIGIPKEEIPYIFEKLYRASNSKNISVKGTGLGLYVVSQIIRAHGGKIKVRSNSDEGTEFTITLPRTRQIAVEGGWL